MSERDGYEPGVPCWIAAVHPDPDGAASFYTQLLDWEVEDLGDYRLCRLAILADPPGAVVGAWQPGGRRGAQVVNEPGAWAWSQLNTSDPDSAKAFYGAVFGWETETFDLGEDSITMWRVPGYVGGEPEQPVARDVVAGMMPAGGDDVPPHWNVDFWVDDVDATAERAAALGGKVVIAPFDTPISRSAALADPQGATFTATTITIGR
jgi:uncharacterized protein